MKEYRTTTNSRVFKILHKEEHASCSHCSWHGCRSENDQWEWYHVYIREERVISYFKEQCRIRPIGSGKHPNWKLVSKNKKQWMKKPTWLEMSWNWRTEDYDSCQEIKWWY